MGRFLTRRAQTRNLLVLLLLLVVPPAGLLFAPAVASGQVYVDVKTRGRLLRSEMLARGAGPGEVALALAGLFAAAPDAKSTMFYVNQARQNGVAPGRVDLVLAELYRRVGRFDAAFSTLGRILVRHPEQPHALLMLWTTLYQCRLQGAEVRTDLALIRDKLVSSGLHFPERFDPAAASPERSRELTAAGYSALVAEKTTYAADLFEAAIGADPSNPQAHRGLGIARGRMEDYARAAGAYLVYQQLDPGAPDAAKVDKVLAEYWKNTEP